MRMQEVRTARLGLRFFHRIYRHPRSSVTPVMFVSGAFQTMDSWSRFVRAFAPHTTIILVDPPGMGGADLLPPDYGVDFLADCLEQVLDEHDIQRVTVVGASYGTPPAFTLAARASGRIDRVVLAGTMKALPERLLGRIAATTELAARFDRDTLASECVAGMLCHDPEVVIDRRTLAARVLRGSITRMTDDELLKYAANTNRLLAQPALDVHRSIDGPEALVFTGEHDVFTSPDDCREVAAAFRRVWFTTVRRADHLFHLQQPDDVVDLIFRFATRTLGAEATSAWYPMESLNQPVREAPHRRGELHGIPC